MPSITIAANTYNYPTAGAGLLASAPQVLSNADTLNVNSGLFETPSGNSTIYSVEMLQNATITVESGATLSYAGSNSSAAPIYSSRSSGNSTQTINIYGTLSAGAGSYAIYDTSSVARNSDNILVNIYPGGIVNGEISLQSESNKSVVYLCGNAALNGTVSINSVGQSSGITVGKDSNNTAYSGTTYTINQAISVPNVNIYNNSTVNFNYSQNINNFNLTNSTLNLNAQLLDNLGISATDTTTSTVNMYVAPTIYYDGATTGIGMYIPNLNIYNEISLNLPGPEAEFQITTLNTILKDVTQYGQFNLSGSILSATYNITNFAITYSGGYFPSGTYTLFSTTEALPTLPTITAVPSNTLFLTFGTPVITAESVTMQITRNKFDQFLGGYAQELAALIEALGNNNPSPDLVLVLDALEASTTSAQLEAGLLQLTPAAGTAGAATQSFAAQNLTLQQPIQRVNSLGYYAAGDAKSEKNVWIRPFGSVVSQGVINGINGYTSDSAGVMLGSDIQGDQNIIGLGIAYVYAHINDKLHADTSTNLNMYEALLYGCKYFAAQKTSYLNWVAAGSYNHFKANRSININTLNLNAASSFSNYNLTVKGILGKIFDIGKHFQLMPEFSAQYSFIDGYSYTETGAPGANLTVNKDNSNVLQLGIGARENVKLKKKWFYITPETYLFGLYNVINSNKNSAYQFVDGGSQIVNNFGPNNATLDVGGGVTFGHLKQNFEVQCNVDLEFQRRYTDFSAYLNLRYKF